MINDMSDSNSNKHKLKNLCKTPVEWHEAFHTFAELYRPSLDHISSGGSERWDSENTTKASALLALVLCFEWHLLCVSRSLQKKAS